MITTTNDPIYFPGNNERSKADDSSSLSSRSLEEVCLFAAETRRPLHLTKNVVLMDTIQLRKRQQLIIVNANADENDKKKPLTVSGNIHSLFLLNNHSQLVLENIDLRHTFDTDDHRNVGAAVNLRYKSLLKSTNCSISSKCGFCCWAVQKTTVTMSTCELRATLRSPVVCFGQTNCTLEFCTIADAGVHAICARGACRITLDHCRILQSAARAVYAYANASVVMRHTHVSGTLRSDKAAVEISATSTRLSLSSPPSTSSSICIRNCEITDNAGVGLLLRGDVDFTLDEDTVFERNAGGNMKRTTSLQESARLPIPNVDNNDDVDNSGEGQPLRRDDAGSSFRQGDWWCPTCQPRRVAVGGTHQCPNCKSSFRKCFCLTIPQIRQLNQGIFVVPHELVALSPSCTPRLPSVHTSASFEEKSHCIAQHQQQKLQQQKYQWFFDGDDAMGEWIPYDMKSNEQLEIRFQEYRVNDCKPKQQSSMTPIVLLNGGKYRVDVKEMKQVNVLTQFLRLVRREEDCKAVENTK